MKTESRVVLKYLWDASEYAICLQRPKWYGWKTTAWIYPSIMQNKSCDEILEYLLWSERDENKRCNSEKSIGKRLMIKCNPKRSKG